MLNASSVESQAIIRLFNRIMNIKQFSIVPFAVRLKIQPNSIINVHNGTVVVLVHFLTCSLLLSLRLNGLLAFL